ncbi:sulfite oxidase [Robertmurraya korlensis]|uniref:sulfite oxidase n=1 Tax=Robertmurraya korlensis TaxID=519977 RepID=UPI00203BBD0B|nr:sulfite oxidase [Robertmurraya korlensis]MCM3601921.1 sulfite oxidase [Robertmurraya korlensis]
MNNHFQPNAKPYLITKSLHPENQESPISFLDNDTISSRLFYRRNHFSYPSLSSSSYWFPVSGHVKKPLFFSLQQLTYLPSKQVKAVLECSGNKRSFFEPKVFGEQWEKGAMSQGIWKGVPLKNVLDLAGIKESALEVVVEGYDYGERKDNNQLVSYTRSLPLEKALHPDTIIAYEYNGKPIPFKHGFPLRLIVPQWYAMASVKWLKQIIVTDSPFTGPFQTVDYVYYPYKESNKEAVPVTNLHVNSTIQHPIDRDILQTGAHTIRGIAWTGQGYIKKVEISTDNGESWNEANIETIDHTGYSWSTWYYHWRAEQKGEYTIMSRATDSNKRVQPKKPFWNRKGYGYHAIDKVRVKLE